MNTRESILLSKIANLETIVAELRHKLAQVPHHTTTNNSYIPKATYSHFPLDPTLLAMQRVSQATERARCRSENAVGYVADNLLSRQIKHSTTLSSTTTEYRQEHKRGRDENDFPPDLKSPEQIILRKASRNRIALVTENVCCNCQVSYI